VTVAEALAAARHRLRSDGEDGRFDAMRLLEDALERNAAWVLAHRDDPIPPSALARFEVAVTRRELGEPVAYIVGTAGFYGRTFRVTRDVLVPRPETEGLVTLALERLRARPADASAPNLCDVGTGSGVLAVSLACEVAVARVTAIDLSPAALAVAAWNARAHGVAGRVACVVGDGLAEVDDVFDLVVANLPYVRTADLKRAPDPTSFEPRLALDGGADGLDAYRRLLADAAARLARPGVLLMEAGPDTVPPLANLARAAFPRATVVVHRDFARLERIVAVDVSA
jgi:release factor glutamine methyltransferase